jgi:hypothetical protein
MPAEKTLPGQLTNYQLLDVGDKFIPVCFKDEGLRFRKDALGNRFVGVCVSDSTRSQEFAECAPVYRLENKPAETASAGDDPGDAPTETAEGYAATAETVTSEPPVTEPPPAPTKPKKS